MLQPQQCQIWAISVTYATAHGNTGSLTHWASPGIQHASLWILFRFVSAEPQWELWIQDLNIWPGAIKLLQENIGSKLPDIWIGNDFFWFDTKSKNKKVELYQTENLLYYKGNHQKWKGDLPNVRKYLQIICLIRHQYLKYIMNSYNPILKKMI